MTLFGCVLPLSPQFDDPRAERNYAPEIQSTAPVQGFVLPQTLSATVTDPNAGDHLYVRWIAEYPPYNDIKTRLMRDDFEAIPPDDNTVPFAVPMVSNVGCGNLAVQTMVHPVTMLVADRAFPTLMTSPNLTREELLTHVSDGALKAEAHWVLNVDCP